MRLRGRTIAELVHRGMDRLRVGLAMTVGPPPAGRISLCYPYYNNSELVRLHYAAWSGYSDEQLDRVRFVIVDDGSATPPPLPDSRLPVTIYRIGVDITWNIPGAKNLALMQATTDWAMISDIDHVVSAEAFGRIYRLPRDNDHRIYTFSRRFPGGGLAETRTEVRRKRFIPATFYLSRRTFLASGGYDEDLAGHYGHDDSLLLWHLRVNLGCRMQRRGEVVLDCYRAEYDAGADPGRRDTTRNAAVAAAKMTPGYAPGPSLRFPWARIHPAET